MIIAARFTNYQAYKNKGFMKKHDARELFAKMERDNKAVVDAAVEVEKSIKEVMKAFNNFVELLSKR
jgi:predicted GIY-YIG superfamily endonuclease